MRVTQNPAELKSLFIQGGVIAYPTEAVFGLGCDPDNEAAVMKLLEIKQRPVDKGLILIAADFSQVEKYLEPLGEAQKAYTQPSETTYVYPARADAPHWLTGSYSSLAVRVTRHPQARQLCEVLGSALVSTSANLSGEEPARSTGQVLEQLGKHIDGLLEGATGNRDQPSEIRDSITGHRYR